MKKPKPQIVNLPTDMTTTSTVVDTPDIVAARSFDPSAIVNASRASNDAVMDRGERQIRESYGNYSGISNPIARSRGLATALDELSYNRALNNAGLTATELEAQQRQKLGLAELTASRTSRQQGYSSTAFQPQSGGLLNTIVSGGISAATAF